MSNDLKSVRSLARSMQGVDWEGDAARGAIEKLCEAVLAVPNGGYKYPDSLFAALKDAGLFVRDYDAVCKERLPRCISELHREVSNIGQTSDLRGWLEMPVGQLLEIYGKVEDMNWFEQMGGLPWRDSKDEE